jgi:hypothetical protein
MLKHRGVAPTSFSALPRAQLQYSKELLRADKQLHFGTVPRRPVAFAAQAVTNLARGEFVRKMDLTDDGADSSKLGWPKAVAIGFALLFVALAIWTAANNYLKPSGGDFISFWSAGRMALEGHAAVAYDIEAHRSIEQTIVPRVGLIPFPYPPPFLLVVAPLSIVPFGAAFVLWILLTGLLYAFAARRIIPLSFAMANPPLLVDYLSGQSGLLISAIFIGGVALVPSAPFTAGLMLGAMILKPQLALLLPIAMVAGREWRVICGAIISCAVLVLAGLVAFGPEAYQSFLQIVPQYLHFMRQNRWDWREFASVYALARYCGLRESAALTTQFLVAALAAAATAIAWLQDWEEKMPILAAGSLLMSAYLLTYDALLLIVPAAYFIAAKRWDIVTLLWLLTGLPVLYLLKVYPGPNTLPLAAILSIALLVVAHVSNRRAESDFEALEFTGSGARPRFGSPADSR